MKYRTLTGTGISVSNLALGTRGFGSETAENDALGILDRSFATGDSRNCVSKRVGLVRLLTVGYKTRPTVWELSRRLDFFVPSEVGRKGGPDKRGPDEKGKEPSRAATSRAVHERSQPGEFVLQERRVHLGRRIPVPRSGP